MERDGYVDNGIIATEKECCYANNDKCEESSHCKTGQWAIPLGVILGLALCCTCLWVPICYCKKWCCFKKKVVASK